jgi:predicted site-specific integrase-resolvase
MTDLKTPAEAAAALHCSQKTLAGHVRSGALRYVIVGLGKKRPRRMFTAEDIQDFIERQMRRDTPATAPRTHRTTTSTSRSDVIAFTALRDARNAAKPKR